MGDRSVSATYSNYNEPVEIELPQVAGRILDGQTATDSVIGSIVVIAPQMIPSDIVGEMTTEAILSYFETSFGWMIIHDSVRISELSQETVGDMQYGAAYYSATDEEDGAVPLYGYFGVATNGGAEDFTVLAFLVEETFPGILGTSTGRIEGDCVEHAYDSFAGNPIGIYAHPIGDGAGATNLSVELLDDNLQTLWEQHNHMKDGEPVAYQHELPEEGGVIVRVCETNGRPAEYELIVIDLNN